MLLRKAANRFSPTQVIPGIAAVAAVAVVLISRANSDDDHEGEAHDVSKRKIDGAAKK